MLAPWGAEEHTPPVSPIGCLQATTSHCWCHGQPSIRSCHLWPPTYAGLCQWAETASQASCVGPPWLDRCRYDLLCNVTSALHVSNSEKDISAAYRGRNAQVWKKLSGNTDDLESVGLQLDSEQNTSTPELREDHVAENSTAAITLLRQHFAEPADVGQTLVQHVLSTMDHSGVAGRGLAPEKISLFLSKTMDFFRCFNILC